MNSIDKEPNYKKIYSFIKENFEKTNYFSHGAFDETYFSMRVYESSKKIMSEIKQAINKEVVLVGAILHDIGKIKLKTSILFKANKITNETRKEWYKHPKLGVPIAKRFLKQLGHSDEFITKVSYLIEHHADRGDKLKNKSIELKILQDADLIADIGYSGFIRPFLYSGNFKKQNVIESIKHLSKENRLKNHKINLNISKRLAKKELAIQNKLSKEIYKNIQSELLNLKLNPPTKYTAFKSSGFKYSTSATKLNQ